MKTIRVLLVEDHLEWQSILLRHIKQAFKELDLDVDITVRTTFSEGLNDLQEKNWDLLISDVGLGGEKIAPQLLGKQLAVVARERKTPCILISGSISVRPNHVREFYKEYRVHDFFWRPSFKYRVFIKSVQELFENQSSNEHSINKDGIDLITNEDRYFNLDYLHTILANEESYDCYAIFLGQPGDKELLKYLTEYQKDIELISSTNWLIISFSKNRFENVDSVKPLALFIKDDIESGTSYKIAHHFNIDMEKLPCLIIFKDMGTEERAIVEFSDKNAEDIFGTLKTITSIINKSSRRKVNPIQLIRRQQSRTKMKVKFSTVGYTLERILEDIITILPKLLST